MTPTDQQLHDALDHLVARADLTPLPTEAPRQPRGDAVPAASSGGRRWLAGVAAAVLVVGGIGAGVLLADDDGQQVDAGDPAVATTAGPTSTPPPATPTTAVTPTTTPAADGIGVLVLNAGGTSAEAGVLTDQLAEAGYGTQPALNAVEPTDITRVYAAGGEEAAGQALAARLGLNPDAVEALPGWPLTYAGTGEARLVIVLGRDWEPGPLR